MVLKIKAVACNKLTCAWHLGLNGVLIDKKGIILAKDPTAEELRLEIESGLN